MIGNKSKFFESWTGPFEIIEVINDEQYKIRNIDSNNEELQNAKFLKPYVTTPYTNMMNRAMMMIDRDNKDRDYDRIIQYVKRTRENL